MRGISALILLILFLGSCSEYTRGDKFIINTGEESITYVVASKGTGKHLAEMAMQMKIEHESKGNTCEITYLTDSINLSNKEGLLLLNAVLPNLEDDFLTKGFFGQFSSKQIVSYLLVAYEDVDKYLIREEKK